MRLAFTTLACPNWTLKQAVEAAHRYGYEGIELRLVDSEILRPDLDTAARNRIRQTCAGLPIVCVDTSVKIAQVDPALREQQVRDGLAFLEMAADWQAPAIRVFGGPPANADEASVISGAAEGMAALAKRGSELGVAALLETHDAFSRARIVGQVLDRATGAGALWDTLHPYRVGEPLPETLQSLGNRLLHVHIKDGRPPVDSGSNWDLTLLGEGQVPIPTILGALASAGYDGWLSVEWEKKWHPDLAEPEIALPQHIEKLREYMRALAL